jgi:hypothetical protein
MIDLSKLESAAKDLESERARTQAELARIESALERLRGLIDDLSGRQVAIPGASLSLRTYAPTVEQVPGPETGYAAAAYHALKKAREPVHIKRLLELIADERRVPREEILENRASVESSLHKATQKGLWSTRIRKVGQGMYEANPDQELA